MTELPYRSEYDLYRRKCPPSYICKSCNTECLKNYNYLLECHSCDSGYGCRNECTLESISCKSCDKTYILRVRSIT